MMDKSSRLTQTKERVMSNPPRELKRYEER